MTEMMWKAFSHSYTSWSSCSVLSPHARKHLLDVRDRRLGQNAVPEIEDERLGCKRLEHSLDLAIERGAAGDERQRVEIALYRPTTLDVLARVGAIDHPIEPNRVDRN